MEPGHTSWTWYFHTPAVTINRILAFALRHHTYLVVFDFFLKTLGSIHSSLTIHVLYGD